MMGVVVGILRCRRMVVVVDFEAEELPWDAVEVEEKGAAVIGITTILHLLNLLMKVVEEVNEVAEVADLRDGAEDFVVDGAVGGEVGVVVEIFIILLLDLRR